MKRVLFSLMTLMTSISLNATEIDKANPQAQNIEKAPQVGEFCWNELATTDVAAAKEFYGKVFGWEFSEHVSDDMTYTMVKKNNKDFAGIWAIPKDQQEKIPAHWMSYILVDNLEEYVEKAQKNKATLIKGPKQAGEFGRFAILQDPTGAHIALWQPLQPEMQKANTK